MTAALLLRIASVLAFIHSVLHTIGGVFGKPAPGAQESTLAIMKANQFPVMGQMRSYGDFYLGFGLFVTIALFAESVVFWQLSGLIKSDAARLRPILGTFVACYLGYAAIAFAYFFPPPGIIEILIAACLGLAMLRSKSALRA
jgi:hypothetical protein